jgi:hypothetical protein
LPIPTEAKLSSDKKNRKKWSKSEEVKCQLVKQRTPLETAEESDTLSPTELRVLFSKRGLISKPTIFQVTSGVKLGCGEVRDSRIHIV